MGGPGGGRVGEGMADMGMADMGRVDEGRVDKGTAGEDRVVDGNVGDGRMIGSCRGSVKASFDVLVRPQPCGAVVAFPHQSHVPCTKPLQLCHRRHALSLLSLRPRPSLQMTTGSLM